MSYTAKPSIDKQEKAQSTKLFLVFLQRSLSFRTRCRYERCKGRFTHSIPCPCRTRAVPLPCRAVPCRAAKGLECVFTIWFTQWGRVWFTLAMPRPCRAHAML